MIAAGRNAQVSAYDASGIRIWTADQPIRTSHDVVANDVTTLFVTELPVPTLQTRVVAYDTRGITNCSGTPKIYTPIWSTTAFDGNLTNLA